MPLHRLRPTSVRRPPARPLPARPPVRPLPGRRLAVRGAGSSLGLRPPRWATVVLAAACALTLGLSG